MVNCNLRTRDRFDRAIPWRRFACYRRLRAVCRESLTVNCSGGAAFGHPATPQGALSDTEEADLRDQRSAVSCMPYREFHERPWHGGGSSGRCPCRALPVSRGAHASASVRRQILLRPDDGQPREYAAARASPPPHGPKVMLRPRDENHTNYYRSNAASRSDACLDDSLLSLAAKTQRYETYRYKAHPPFHHRQSGLWLRRLASPAGLGKARARTSAVKRLVYAKQNAHRCDPSGGDPGGCGARQSCRRIRLRICQP
jgi:hypothetical protein